MKKVFAAFVVAALLVLSGSALAGPVPTAKALEVRQAADRDSGGPALVRTAMELLDRIWEWAAKSIGNQGEELSARQKTMSTEQDFTTATATRKSIGNQG